MPPSPHHTVDILQLHGKSNIISDDSTVAANCIIFLRFSRSLCGGLLSIGRSYATIKRCWRTSLVCVSRATVEVQLNFSFGLCVCVSCAAVAAACGALPSIPMFAGTSCGYSQSARMRIGRNYHNRLEPVFSPLRRKFPTRIHCDDVFYYCPSFVRQCTLSTTLPEMHSIPRRRKHGLENWAVVQIPAQDLLALTIRARFSINYLWAHMTGTGWQLLPLLHAYTCTLTFAWWLNQCTTGVCMRDWYPAIFVSQITFSGLTNMQCFISADECCQCKII